MQSFSGIILSRNEALLADHPVIIFFLTMLVGAGGNAGNQASVRGTYIIIRKWPGLFCSALPNSNAHNDEMLHNNMGSHKRISFRYFERKDESSVLVA